MQLEVLAGNPASVTVFLHGLLGRGRNLLQATKSVADLTTPVLIDQPNHGDSPWSAHFSYAQMAAEMAATIRQLPQVAAAGNRVQVVGHSMGGKTAMQLALAFPELVANLVVVDIAPRTTAKTSQFQELLHRLLAIDLATLPSRAAADAQLAASIPDAGLRAFLLANLVRSSTGNWRWQANLELFASELDAVLDFTPPANACYTGPVLWIAGANSDYIQAADHPTMLRFFPDTVPLTIPDAGHWVHADQPAAFSQALREFYQTESKL